MIFILLFPLIGVFCYVYFFVTLLLLIPILFSPFGCIILFLILKFTPVLSLVYSSGLSFPFKVSFVWSFFLSLTHPSLLIFNKTERCFVIYHTTKSKDSSSGGTPESVQWIDGTNPLSCYSRGCRVSQQDSSLTHVVTRGTNVDLLEGRLSPRRRRRRRLNTIVVVGWSWRVLL